MDVQARRMFRYFSGDFNSGGRLFRGFWENLKKGPRRLGLRIEGEHTVELDYSQLNPTLAYAHRGLAVPMGDAYTLNGLEDHRDAVKMLFNALLFDTEPRQKLPKDVRAALPLKFKPNTIIAAIQEKHPGLASVFAKGLGFQLMFQESEIMMGVLERLLEQRIVGLPLFDALIVKASEAIHARAIMVQAFEAETEQNIEVKIIPATAA